MNRYQIIFFCLSFIACSNSPELLNKNLTQDDTLTQVFAEYKSIDTNSFEGFVLMYKPNNIDISKDINDSLNHYQVKAMFNEISLAKKDRWVTILLLKQYLYHLKKANQGYDLYPMRNGETTVIINSFIQMNHLKENGEFLNSGIVVDVTLKKQSLVVDNTIKLLLNDIEKETQRILH